MYKKKEISSKREDAALEEIEENFPELVSITKKELLFRVYDDENEFLASKDELLFFQYEGRFLPTLQLLRKMEVTQLISFPKVKVDAGAVQHMISGADVFAPGITDHDTFKKGDIVLVINPASQILCIGEAVTSSSAIEDSGTVIHNVHHLTDDIFNNEVLE